MILVTGGIASGKRTYLRSLGFAESEMSADPTACAPVLLGLEELLRDGPLDDASWEAIAGKQAVVCCEVGQGVVPIDADERAWRELVGRTAARLAAQADAVVRLVCGIPVTIKGSVAGRTS